MKEIASELGRHNFVGLLQSPAAFLIKCQRWCARGILYQCGVFILMAIRQ